MAKRWALEPARWFLYQFWNKQIFHWCVYVLFICFVCWGHILLTQMIRPQRGYVGALQEACNANMLVTKRVQKMISDSVYPAKSGIACLFCFDWYFRFAKIWGPDEFIGSTYPKRGVSRQVWTMGNLRATIVTTGGIWYIPISAGVPNSMPHLIDSYLILVIEFIYIYIY